MSAATRLDCCDVTAAVSCEIDGETPAHLDAVGAHLAVCAACRRFRDDAWRVHRVLHVRLAHEEPGGDAPCAPPLSRARWPARSIRPTVAAVAAFVVAATLGAVSAHIVLEPDPAVAARSEIVATAQMHVDSLVTAVELTEHDDSGAVRMHVDGTLTYVAPESMSLVLTDGSRGVEFGVNESAAWSIVDGQATVTRGRAPFDAATWSAFEAIVPVASFSRDAQEAELVTLDGSPAISAEVTVAQIAPLLDALRVGWTWTTLPPSDRATVWLDPETATPRRVEAGRFVVEWRNTIVNSDAASVPAPPATAARDIGFVDRAVDAKEVPQPAWLPTGMIEHRSGEGTLGGMAGSTVRSWTDGRSWVRVTATRTWGSARLFGGLGPNVRPVRSGGSIAYLSPAGDRVPVHGRDGAGAIDVVVDGSVEADTLMRIARSLPITAESVPSEWPEAASIPLDDRRQFEMPTLIPTASIDTTAASRRGDRVEMTIAGPGGRSALLVQRPGSLLPPPQDPDARAVAVRGRTARFSPNLGELIWIEDGTEVTLFSDMLSADSMVELATSLDWTT
jgi:hypothetical protein